MKPETLQLSLRSQISHDMLTPLSGIIGLLQFLKATQITQEQKEYITDIQSSVTELLGTQGKIDTLLSQCIYHTK